MCSTDTGRRPRLRPPSQLSSPGGRSNSDAGSQLAALTLEEIQASDDHELLNWIIALGIIGDTPSEIVNVHESHTQLAFRVAAIWEQAGI